MTQVILGVYVPLGAKWHYFGAMRVFLSARRVLIVATTSLLFATLMTAAEADEATPDNAASMQIELVKSRQQINNLYGEAAAASERLNGAQYYLEQAKANVAQQQNKADKAARAVAEERESVAALTVQDLQSNNSMSRLGTLFDSKGPGQLLDRSNTYDSTREGLQARIDKLSASEVVYDAAKKRAGDAMKQQQAAFDDSAAAKADIESMIAQAEAATQEAERKRPVLLRKLAKAQDLSVAKVTARQDEIDAELDAMPAAPTMSNPPTSTPPSADSAPDPRPEVAPETKPDPRPEPKPEPKPKPKPPAPKPPAPKPPSPAPAGGVEQAIAYAKAQLGEPYRWGGAGPSSWDCSGLTMRAFASAGYNMPHFAAAQYNSARRVSMGNLRRGDLLFWSNGSVRSIYHVAIYLGDGMMINAPRTGRNVEIKPLSYWRPDMASRVG